MLKNSFSFENFKASYRAKLTKNLHIYERLIVCFILMNQFKLNELQKICFKLTKAKTVELRHFNMAQLNKRN